MNRSQMFIAVVLALAVGVSTDAYAQRHGNGGRARGGAPATGRATPRAEGAPRAQAPPRAQAAPRAEVRGGVVAGPRAYSPRVVRVAPVRFYQPYYTFRPRLSLGFGLWLGYPVRYTSYYGYYNPYYYPYPYDPYAYPYGYPAAPYPAYPPSAYPPAYPPTAYPPSAYPPAAPSGTYPQSGYPAQPPQGSISASQANTGGVSFEIQPSDAQVSVDGQYVGTVGQFTPTSQPLGLTAGRHHIQISAPGYRTMDFDVDVVAGEVLPYQGALER